MKMLFALLFCSVSFGQGNQVTVAPVSVGDSCKPFIGLLNTCEAAECDIQQIQNGTETAFRYVIFGMKNSKCEILIETKGPIGARKYICSYNAMQRRQWAHFLKYSISNKEFSYSATKCDSKDKTCLIKVGEKKMLNVFRLGLLHGQCTISE